MGKLAVLVFAIVFPALVAAAPAKPVSSQPVQAGTLQGPEAMMAKALELTPAQEPGWKAEADRARAVLNPLWDKLGRQIGELREMVARKASDSVISAQVEAVNATRLAIRTEQDKCEANYLAILTPVQQARFVTMFADRLRQGLGRRTQIPPRGANRR